MRCERSDVEAGDEKKKRRYRKKDNADKRRGLVE